MILYHYMHSFFFAFSGCRIIEIFFFTFLFFILCIAFTFQIHFHIHIFTSEVTCYFCYRLTILLPLNCVPMQPLLRRDVSGTASRCSRCYVVTQFRAHRQGGKKHQNAGCNPERRTFRFVKYLSIVYGIVNFLPVCASTV